MKEMTLKKKKTSDYAYFIVIIIFEKKNSFPLITPSILLCGEYSHMHEGICIISVAMMKFHLHLLFQLQVTRYYNCK